MRTEPIGTSCLCPNPLRLPDPQLLGAFIKRQMIACNPIDCLSDLEGVASKAPKAPKKPKMEIPSTRPPAFEEIEHTADYALRIRGRDLGELLYNAALGLNSLMRPEFGEPATKPVERQIELEALDAESLLVEWLGELAYLAETELLAFTEFDLQQAEPERLKATVRGARTVRFQKHIKAVTFHNLAIVRSAAGLEVTVVFDV